MKKVLLIAFSILAANLASADSKTCQNQVVNAVQIRVAIDYPGQNLTVLPPDMQRWDGGEEKSLSVNVTGETDQIEVVYTVTIDEVCSIQIQGRQT
jgi:hypothetical protein